MRPSCRTLFLTTRMRSTAERPCWTPYQLSHVFQKPVVHVDLLYTSRAIYLCCHLDRQPDLPCCTMYQVQGRLLTTLLLQGLLVQQRIDCMLYQLCRRVAGVTRGSAALDLLQRMLAYDPAQRITAAQCLEHPYFSEVLQQHTPGSDESICRQLASACPSAGKAAVMLVLSAGVLYSCTMQHHNHPGVVASCLVGAWRSISLEQHSVLHAHIGICAGAKARAQCIRV